MRADNDIAQLVELAENESAKLATRLRQGGLQP